MLAKGNPEAEAREADEDIQIKQKYIEGGLDAAQETAFLTGMSPVAPLLIVTLLFLWAVDGGRRPGT